MGVVQNGNRAEDQDPWAKLALLRQRYWPVLWALVALALALGFDFKTPRMYYQEGADRDAATEARVTALEQSTRSTDTKIDVLLRFQCIDASVTARERQAAGLDCDRLLNGTLP